MTNIKICSWNANGLKNKLGEVIEFISRNKIDIFLINETRLCEKDKLKVRNYNCIRKDKNYTAGGVAILVKKDLAYQECVVTSTIECIIIKLASNIFITAAYNSPANNFTTQDLNSILGIGNKVLLIGDLNARHITWNNHVNNRRGLTLFDYTLTNNCSIIFPDEPTHYPTNNSTPTTIDIAVNKNVNNVSDLQVLHELNSDHTPVVLKLGSQKRNSAKKTAYNYTEAGWDMFRKHLDKKITLTSTIKTKDELDQEVLKFTNDIRCSMDENIKKTTFKELRDKLPETILQMIKQRNHHRKIWQRSRQKKDKEKVTRLTHQIRTSIINYRNNEWSTKLEKLNPRDNSLWRMTKILKMEDNTIPTLVKNGAQAFTDCDKANLLADQLEQVHNIDLENNTDNQKSIVKQVKEYLDVQENENWYQFITSPRELSTIIKQLPSKKAPGLDAIQNIVLKNFSRKALVQLNYIINNSIKLSYFPQHWKIGQVVPIKKPGKISTDPSSYRPISLLPTMSKVCEKVILKRLTQHEEKNNIIVDHQFGFRNGIIYKMIKFNYPPTLIKYVHSYLTDRCFEVTVNGSLSTKRKIRAGVPQGSVIGPKLFNIYLNDIPTFQKTSTALFADDTAIYAHSFSAITAAKQLQIHINILEKYYTDWKISLNASKTELIVFAKKCKNLTIFQPIKVYNHSIKPTNSTKYLGVHLDPRLIFNTHIKQVIRKAFIVQKKLYPMMVKGSTLTVKNKKLLYTMILRPILTYASPVWCGASLTNLLLLQRYQNKCLRLILSEGRYTKISKLHEDAEIPLIKDFIYRLANNFY
ncbi:GSCOCG00011676001-RA-CDS, partial [Cotesia congregata]